MEFMMHEHVKVESVEGGIAVCTVRIPVEMLDDIMSMADHMIHASRWINTRYRVSRATKNPVLAIPRFGVKNK